LEAYKSIKYRLPEEAPVALNSLIDVEMRGESDSNIFP
jgi:hypothetical protein